MSNRRPKIDPTRLSKSSRRNLERVQNTLFGIGVEMSKHHEACLDAVRNTFDRMLERREGDPLLVDLFVALELAATKSDAKLIADHFLRPDEVDDVLERRRAETARAVAETAAE